MSRLVDFSIFINYSFGEASAVLQEQGAIMMPYQFGIFNLCPALLTCSEFTHFADLRINRPSFLLSLCFRRLRACMCPSQSLVLFAYVSFALVNYEED